MFDIIRLIEGYLGSDFNVFVKDVVLGLIRGNWNFWKYRYCKCIIYENIYICLYFYVFINIVYCWNVFM